MSLPELMWFEGYLSLCVIGIYVTEDILKQGTG